MHEEVAIDSDSLELGKLCALYLIHRMIFFLENIDTVRIATQSIYDAEIVLFGDLTPEAEELEIEYYKRTLTWVKQISVSHEIPAASVPEPIDEDNIPGFLTSTLAFIKIEKKLEVGFKKIETMLDYLETRVANVEHSMSNGKSRWRPMPCVW
ncbi:hypothetical protein LIER_32374 [Lithospermum erythrorhizon]|uniref:Uncharacterized protein n=1 Tax=Lithospermum erythrorhizon TaxID=34254 RepID=A0AAV3RZ15_LITER